MAKRPKQGKPASIEGQGELTQSPFAALAGLSVTKADRIPANRIPANRNPAIQSPAIQSPAAAPASAIPTAAAGGEVTAESEGPRFDQKVVVRREKKGRGGKTVTRISGLPAAHQQALAKRMKKNLGCGASLDAEDVLLHGSLVERAATWLEGQGARRVVRAN